MTYVDGFVTAVPTGGQKHYLAFARKAWKMFQDLGALSTAECWGDQVPDGNATDFKRAVQLKPDETVVFSWIIWPDKATRDKAWATMMDASVTAELGAMPFDGKRMIYGGFSTIFNSEDK